MTPTRKTVSADSGRIFETIRNLWPYMWPAGRADLKLRVVWATLFLLLSKIVLLSVPYFFKWSTDALAGKPAGQRVVDMGVDIMKRRSTDRAGKLKDIQG